MTKEEARQILSGINPSTGAYDPDIPFSLQQEANQLFYGSGQTNEPPPLVTPAREPAVTQPRQETITPREETITPRDFSGSNLEGSDVGNPIQPLSGANAGQYAFGGPVPETEFTTTDDPLKMTAQNRAAARAWGQALDQTLRDTANQYQNLEGNFREQVLGGPGGYGDILAGQGGFTPEQEANLVQRGLVEGGMATPQQLESQYLQDWEKAQIYGQPYSPFDFAGGQVQRLSDLADTGANRQREADAYLDARLADAVNQNNLRVSESYKPELQGLISRAGQGYSDILDPNYLAVNPEFYGAAAGTIGNLATGYGEAIDPSKLAASQEFQQRYDFTPRDYQDMVDAAGRTVGFRTQAERDNLMRAAVAEGNTSPLAIQAAIARGKVYGDIGAADAMTNARIAAGGVGRDVAMGREGVRLGTQRDISNRYTGALENLAGMELGQTNLQEQMRLAAEQDLANKAMQAWSETTGRALGATQDYEAQRRAAEQDISNRLMGIGSETGQARRATESELANRAQQVGQYGTSLLTGLEQYGEAEAARRAQNLAQNRQQIGYSNIDTRFQQAMPASEALASRYGTVYGQKKAEEAEGRSALTGQQTRAQEGGLTSAQQRIAAGGVQFPSMNQSAGTAVLAKNLPTLWDKISGGIIGGIGAFTP